jgi:hypothetical protein
MRPRALCGLVLVAVLLELGCRVPGDGDAPEQEVPAERAIAATLDALYDAFCFDPHGEPDWGAMRALFAAGAAFYGPAGDAPVGVDAERFLADFAAYAARPPFDASGLHERIVHARIDAYGAIAHAYVAFEGFVPGQPGVVTRGLDGIQLVKAGERWLVASFTTQFESPALPMPARFLGTAR